MIQQGKGVLALQWKYLGSGEGMKNRAPSKELAVNRARNAVTVGKEEKPRRGQMESCRSNENRDRNKDGPAGARTTI